MSRFNNQVASHLSSILPRTIHFYPFYNIQSSLSVFTNPFKVDFLLSFSAFFKHLKIILINRLLIF